jgi:hypothetical protein
MNPPKHLISAVLILTVLVAPAVGCRKGRESPAKTGLDILMESDPAVWSITSGGTTQILDLPSGKVSYEGSADEVLAVWVDGILKKTDSTVEWLDYDPGSGGYESNPGVDLTSWETPIAVDPVARIIYAFGHSVPPSRVIQEHYLDGREPREVGQLVADEVEVFSPFPSNGWPVFYVDRPGQAGAITIDESPTRKTRIYGGEHIGGEYPDVLEVFFLRNEVAVKLESEGWVFMEIDGRVVEKRTMSLGQIPGVPRPMARVGDAVLVAADDLADDGVTVTGSRLYLYGLYSRTVDLVWDPVDLMPPAKILALAVKASGDYYIVLGSPPDMKILTLVRYRGDSVEIIASLTLPEPVTATSVFFIPPAEPELAPPIEVSVGTGEDAVEKTSGDSHTVQQPYESTKLPGVTSSR